jgi:hypothetical protein
MAKFGGKFPLEHMISDRGVNQSEMTPGIRKAQAYCGYNISSENLP